MTRLMIVGEQRSETARRRGWTWRDGRLAAKPLFEALTALGIDPATVLFANLWRDGATSVSSVSVRRIRRELAAGTVVVALGKRVQTELDTRHLTHVALVHPAARGRIRKRERYIAHVVAQLGDVVMVG